MYGESEEPIRVAAAVLKRNDQVLICQRGINRRYGLKWEFPGGKIYPGEQLGECLERELWEELDIEPVEYTEIKTLQTTYPDGGKFLITFFLVNEYEGEIKNKVFENIAWVTIGEVDQYDLLDGSRPVLQYL